MSRGKHKFGAGLLGGLLSALLLGGCGDTEQTKVIVLPPLESQETDSEKLQISRIREYAGSGREGDRMCLTWGDSGTDMLYMVKIEDGSYRYQVVDTRKNETVSDIWMDDRTAEMENVSIAPGGRYVVYEVRGQQGGKELIAFFPEKRVWGMLESWEDPQEIYSYVWSDDGTALVSWQSGDTGSPDADWRVSVYYMTTAILEEGGKDGFLPVFRAQCLLKGRGRSWRIVLPNRDGTEVYVREQLRTFGDSSDDGKNDEMDDGRDAANWLLLPEYALREELAEYSRAPVYPVKYTSAGLFIQEEDGTLCLVEDIRSNPVKKELIPADPKRLTFNPYICENGDHVFLMEWVNDSMYQVSGVRVVDGETQGVPVVLFKDHYDSLVQMTVQGDQTVMFWGREYLDGTQYRYRVTALEY